MSSPVNSDVIWLYSKSRSGKSNKEQHTSHVKKKGSLTKYKIQIVYKVNRL